jgi:hypothetical protein
MLDQPSISLVVVSTTTISLAKEKNTSYTMRLAFLAMVQQKEGHRVRRR